MDKQIKRRIRNLWRDRFLLGGAVSGLMLVPIINLVAPVIGAAAGTHLTQRCMLGQRDGGVFDA